MRTAVVGHTEWVDFLRVPAVPGAGDIVHASEWWEEPGGGGAVAAVQMVRLAGECVFYTALGDDDLGRRAHEALTERGVRVEAAWRAEPQRRAITHVDASGERTITVLGDRLSPRADDPLDWSLLDGAGAVFFTSGDAGALRLARSARVLVATPRAQPALTQAGVALDAVVGSATDPAERFAPADADPPPRLVVATEGARGGTWRVPGGPARRYEAAPLPGPVADAYGCGDTFAVAIALGLAAGFREEQAIGYAARCGAAVLTGRGPYGAPLPALP